MTASLDLASALSTRICHDLVSPVGAVVNGIDLIREISQGNVNDELGMVAQSAERASGLLQFYRIAFGSADADAPEIAGAEMQHLISSLLAGQRTGLEWQLPAGVSLPRARAQILANATLVARSMLGLRGTIVVAPAAEGRLSVTARGERAECQPEQAAILNGSSSGPARAREVEFFLLSDLAARASQPVAIESGEGFVTLTV